MTDTETARPAPWGLATTFGWSVLAVVAGQMAAAVGLLVWLGPEAPARIVELFDGPMLAVTTIIANAVQIGVLVWAVHRRGWRPSNYFAFTWFTRRDFLLSILICVAVGGALALTGWLAGLDLVTPFQIQVYTTTPKNVWLAVVFAVMVLVAPLGEEITFRGFMFRGWVRPAGNPLIPIVVISLLWAIQHIQYDWWGILQVFVLGILFGVIRWSTGSTLLTFVLHALVNVDAAIETVVKVEWF